VVRGGASGDNGGAVSPQKLRHAEFIPFSAIFQRDGIFCRISKCSHFQFHLCFEGKALGANAATTAKPNFAARSKYPKR
jgi:hypothetical protein